jgi:hypothetical protein
MNKKWHLLSIVQYHFGGLNAAAHFLGISSLVGLYVVVLREIKTLLVCETV